MKDQLLIGGLDARLWVGRRVRVNSKRRGVGHCMRAMLIEIRVKTGEAVVKPSGHRRVDVVPIGEVLPWWSHSPDLKRSADRLPVV